ncbi:MAG: cyclic nucleotide-binding domain-containing protein [Verrucomicrobiota bacterium]|nr:cyclic nucleotide-binding domain-containing protein [Limisphaera sp.]MDW8380796.1 cyclic nucleotide-binding domain-containing protein [Verrucomicrobiota bacterium]
MATLGDHPIFSCVPPPLMNELVAAARRFHLPAGSHLVREGEPGDGLYLLEEGTVEITLATDDACGRILTRLGPGDLFGEMAVLEEKPRSAGAIARTEVRVWFIPREAVLNIIRQCPELTLRFLRELSRRLREFNRIHIEQTLQMERLALLGRFARTIFHDLKSPLNVLQLTAEMGLAPDAAPHCRAEALQRIKRQIERINDSIHEIMLFTEGRAEAELSLSTEYRDFLHSLAEELATETALREVQLNWNSRSWPSGRVRLQPRRLRRVLQNLVHNACDMLSPGGRIELRLFNSSTTAITEVHDNGPGIADEIRPRLFEPFATYGKAQGTGLGLSICRKIIEDHGGTIEAGSSDLGGAMFRFTLPWCR